MADKNGLMKSKRTAYLLWFFLGFWGVHKFYLNKTGIGVLYMFTGGLLGIGWLIDLFTLGKQVDTYNQWIYPLAPADSPPRRDIIRPTIPSKSPKHRKRKAVIPPGTKILRIVYKDAAGVVTNRDIQAVSFKERNGKKYIYAYCYIHQKVVCFLVPRIMSMTVDGEKIKDIPGYLAREYGPEKIKAYPAEVNTVDLAAQALSDPE
jgi:TM2 domain-containing membrane protein YozV